MSCARDKNVSSSDPVQSLHLSVLLHEVLEALSVQPNSTIVDATVGGAGHAREIIRLLGDGGTFVGIDADGDALACAKKEIKSSAANIHLVNDNFRNIDCILKNIDIEAIDGCLFDLGWRIDQLHAGRGFSFKEDGPLLMTYDSHPPEDALTARVIVNQWEEDNIADVLYGWGEERASRAIAAAIVKRRKEKLIETSRELADIVAQAVPRRKTPIRGKKIHPATKTFQALRMAVNQEMDALKEGLFGAREYLNSHGRIAVITFHSIEDRFVKRLFRTWEQENFGKVHKKIKPTDEEIAENPRARSALLRTFEAF